MKIKISVVLYDPPATKKELLDGKVCSKTSWKVSLSDDEKKFLAARELWGVGGLFD